MNKVLFTILRGILFLVALLPFAVLYVISDFLYLLVYHVVRYRRKVVRTNLVNSFPDKNIDEIKKIERGFYHHFCDTFIETVKLLHISDEEIKKRFKYKNIEVMNDIFKDKQSIFIMLGHYGNWEWVTSITLWLKHPYDSQFICGEIYRPLKNKAADNFFLKLRSRFDTFNLPKNSAFKDILKIKKTGTQMVVGFISDQSPSKANIHLWVDFLNQDTPCIIGAEKIAQKIDAALVFCDIVKVKRGYYEIHIKPMTEDPKSCEEFAITKQYMKMLENCITRQPELWLWSHKRWKNKR